MTDFNFPPSGKPDPSYKARLNKAASQIAQIVADYDLGGIVILTAPNHMQSIGKISPSWSCLQPNKDNHNVLSLVVNGSDFDPQQSIAPTMGMLEAMLKEMEVRQNDLRIVLEKMEDALGFSVEQTTISESRRDIKLHQNLVKPLDPDDAGRDEDQTEEDRVP